MTSRVMTIRAAVTGLVFAAAVGSLACDRPAPAPTRAARVAPDSVEARFQNVANAVDYVGDSSCVRCHAAAAASYAQHSMAKSFHPWTANDRVERAMAEALRNESSGYAYKVVDSAGALWQVETRPGDAASPVHELRRRMDYVMGSGRLARTYFTEENGRLFQLPLTWYANHGWDFSPGYEINNARFSRVMPDRCIACHASYPTPAAHLEGKYPVLRPGIGCERCHGPGALHVAARQTSLRDSTALTTIPRAYDATIVNPARLPLDRRMDVCEQCHVHTSVAVLREQRTAFDFTPARQLEAQYAYFKNGGDIDLVSHADRLKQSACFLAAVKSEKPLECATCHNPHAAPPTKATRNQPCLSCHTGSTLGTRFSSASAKRTHAPTADCVGCHMPVVKERTVPHGTFSDHWIRVPGRATPRPAVAAGPIEPYFARDRTGAEGALYTAMGKVVFASLANDGKVFDNVAAELAPLLANDDAHPHAHFLLGVAHQTRGRHEEAAEALETAVRLGDDRPDVLRALAQARLRLGDHAAARMLYERALTKQPALAWMRAEYADLLQWDGELANATREYQTALVEQPSLPAASFNLGLALLAQQQVAGASNALLKAIALEPAFASALDALLQVDGSDKKVRQLTRLPSPLPMVRRATPGTASFGVLAGASTMVQFTNTPANGFVLVYTPDGTLLLAVPTNAGGTVMWDVRGGDGRVLGPGLYRAEVQARGMAAPLPTAWFALLRK